MVVILHRETSCVATLRFVQPVSGDNNINITIRVVLHTHLHFPVPVRSDGFCCCRCFYGMACVRALGQAAAAVVVQQKQGVDVQADKDQEAIDAKEAAAQSLAERYEAAQGLKERQMMEEEQAGTVLDKYTQIYIPVRGEKRPRGVWVTSNVCHG